MKLFFLPALALIQILKCLDPFELLLFAQCSNRSANFIKLSGTKRYNMRIIKRKDTYEIKIGKFIFEAKNTSNMKDYDTFMNQKIMGTSVPTNSIRTIYYANQMNFFWNDESSGFRDLVEHLVTIFNCPVYLFFSDDHNWGLPILQFIKTRQSKIDCLKICVEDCTADKISSILQDLKVTERVYVESELTDDFQYPEEHISPVMHFQHASWFKVNNFLLTKCVKLILQNSNLTNQHLNQFMKNWDSLAHPNLEWLEIESKKFNGAPVFGHPIPINYYNTKQVQKNCGGETTFTTQGAFIKRSDGADAFLFLDGPLFTLFLNFKVAGRGV